MIEGALAGFRAVVVDSEREEQPGGSAAETDPLV